jgi:hypothetical protein
MQADVRNSLTIEYFLLLILASDISPPASDFLFQSYSSNNLK